MVVCYAQIVIRLFGVDSLKEKRSIVRSLVADLKKRFEVSAIESARQDSKDYACIGLSFVTLNEKDCEEKMDNIEKYVEQFHVVEDITYDFHHFS
ncbi:DUF503 domain-containing protein [Fervidobacterium thailandense]|uniref:DUF503 domain-containing protein n=1 Tax=Fervidobacterium thailandense TaxID=1008305 RepID=A0A1E3G4E6_9BACT|nr:DUF503 domain-containing protein [Fervidobacterium thailandense]ODN31161.1 hypothetical protein A4H02_02570 [Fervidobacterium thailandense]